MNLAELKEKIKEFQYMEDTGVIDVVLAGILSTRLSLGSPVWLIIIGASSGGKTQILRPLTMTDDKFIFPVDDLTPNTLLSGANVGKGKSGSLLDRIGKKGIIAISDLTVLFSKANEARDEILAAFRMLYDGHYTKNVGNKAEALSWHGQIGIIAGSTPSVYSHFESVADMGERFIYYRMREYDSLAATRIAMSREIYGEELNQKLCGYYTEYLKNVMELYSCLQLPAMPRAFEDRIIRVAVLTEKIRTTARVDWQGNMNKLPVSAYPMRLSLQMRSIARGLQIMRLVEGEELGPEDSKILDWCGYSLANEEKRACLRKLCERPFDSWIKTQTVSDLVGLDETVIQPILQNLSAIGIVARSGNAQSGHGWRMASEDDWKLIREIEGIERFVATEVTKEPEVITSAEEPEQVNLDFMGKGWDKD